MGGINVGLKIINVFLHVVMIMCIMTENGVLLVSLCGVLGRWSKLGKRRGSVGGVIEIFMLQMLNAYVISERRLKVYPYTKPLWNQVLTYILSILFMISIKVEMRREERRNRNQTKRKELIKKVMRIIVPCGVDIMLNSVLQVEKNIIKIIGIGMYAIN